MLDHSRHILGVNLFAVDKTVICNHYLSHRIQIGYRSSSPRIWSNCQCWRILMLQIVVRVLQNQSIFLKSSDNMIAGISSLSRYPNRSISLRILQPINLPGTYTVWHLDITLSNHGLSLLANIISKGSLNFFGTKLTTPLWVDFNNTSSWCDSKIASHKVGLILLKKTM